MHHSIFKMRKIARIACQVSTQYTASIKIDAKRHEKQKVWNPMLAGFTLETTTATGEIQTIWRNGKGKRFLFRLINQNLPMTSLIYEYKNE